MSRQILASKSREVVSIHFPIIGAKIIVALEHKMPWMAAKSSEDGFNLIKYNPIANSQVRSPCKQ